MPLTMLNGTTIGMPAVDAATAAEAAAAGSAASGPLEISKSILDPLATATVISSVTSVFHLLSITIAIAILVRLALWHYSRRRLYELGARVAGGPPVYPIIGNAYVLFGNNTELLSNLLRFKKKYGTTYKLWLGPNLTYMLSNVKDIDILMTSYKAINKSISYKFLEPVIGQTVFNSDLERWRKLRRIVEPTFGKKVVESFMEVFSNEALNLVEKIDYKNKQDCVNLYDLLGNCTYDVLCQAAMGVKLDTEKTAPEWFYLLNTGMEVIIRRMVRPWLHIDLIYNNTAQGKLLNRRMTDFNKYAHYIITEKRNVLDRKEYEFKFVENDTKRKAFLDLMMELKDKDDILSDAELLDEVILVLIAGTDSTATTIAYALEMIGMHPEIQEKVYQELIEICGPLTENNNSLTYKDIANLKYLEMVIKESMRVLPTIPIIARNIMEELELDTCTLPVGATATVDIINVHRDASVWPDPLRFDPDRFLPENCAKRSIFAWLPFAAGPRNCLGMQFAMTEMKTILAYLIRRYQITTEYKTIGDIKLALSFLLKPVDGFKYSYIPRE